MSRIKPQQGKFYKVISGDNILKVAYWAYGASSYYPKIMDGNAELLQPRIKAGRIQTGISVAGLPIIYVGDTLWIPAFKSKNTQVVKKVKIDADYPDEVAIRINGKVFKGWTTNSIERAVNTITDSFSFTAPFNWQDDDSKYLDPYTFYETDLFIGGDLFLAGVANAWSPRFSTDSTMTTISVRSKAGVLIDCPPTDKQLSYYKQTLKQITEKVISVFGIGAEFPHGDSGIINKAKRSVGEKTFQFIAGLSKKFGYVINSTIEGGIKFDRANIDGKPILELIQGQQPLLDLTATYDGTKRFSDFIANSQSRSKSGNTATVKDETIPVKRPIIFDAKDTDQGNILDSAKWERSRSLARSAPITAKIKGWRDKNGDVIIENNVVTLYAPNIHIYNETKFLIEKISFSEEGGKTATLNLVLPQAYTLEFPKILPWSR